MDQLSIDFPDVVEPEYGPDMTIQQRFEAFHQANPHVYEQLVELALGLKRRGHRRYSIAGLFEVLRYNHALRTHGDDFKLNNNYRALYSRLIMRKEPRLHGFFETRKRRTA